MRYGQHIITRLGDAFISALIVISLIGSFSARSYAQDAPAKFVKGEVIVEISPTASIENVNARRGTSTIERIYGTNIYRLRTPNGKKEKKQRKKLAKDPDVLSAWLNPVMLNPISVFARSQVSFPDGRPTVGQTRESYVTQPIIENMPEVHLRSRGQGILIAVIDTGIDANHPDVAAHLWSNPQEAIDGLDNDGNGLIDDHRGWDFASRDNDPSEEPGAGDTSIAGHGTFIAGLIALVAPESRIIPIRAFNAEGISDAFSVASAIKYAADKGARVINLSFGSPEQSDVLRDAISYARQKGAVLVAAVGNDNKNNDNNPEFPSGYNQEVIGVAAIDTNNRKAEFSNFGSGVSVSAPGVRLISLYPRTDRVNYATWSGTSFAAPLASAEAALILEASPNNTDVKTTIESTATSIDGSNPGFAGMLGRGRINPLEALRSLTTSAFTGGEIRLIPSGVEGSARGEAEVKITGSEQEFEVEAEGLLPRAAYKIVVNGAVLLNSVTASSFGGLKVEFADPPRDNHLPLPPALKPVTLIRQVELRDSQDRVVLSASFGASNPGGTVVEKEAYLASTGVISGAEGKARAKIESEREELRVEAEDLQSGASYEIIADGISLGSVAAQSGYFRVEFTSDGRSGLLLPASLRPVTKIQRIELRNQAGQVVLQGVFQAGGDDFGGGGGDDDGGGDDGGGGGGQDVSLKADLNPTGDLDDAEGRFEVRIKDGDEEFEVEAKELRRNTQYRVVVDGFDLGLITTDGDGEFERTWTSKSGSLPAEIRPVSNIRRVEIFDALGRSVLAGGPPS
jgi:subtilisin family serine protease